MILSEVNPFKTFQYPDNEVHLKIGSRGLDRLLVIDRASVHISGEVNDRVCVHASGGALEDQKTFNLKCRKAYLDISYV